MPGRFSNSQLIGNAGLRGAPRPRSFGASWWRVVASILGSPPTLSSQPAAAPQGSIPQFLRQDLLYPTGFGAGRALSRIFFGGGDRTGCAPQFWGRTCCTLQFWGRTCCTLQFWGQNRLRPAVFLGQDLLYPALFGVGPAAPHIFGGQDRLEHGKPPGTGSGSSNPSGCLTLSSANESWMGLRCFAAHYPKLT